MATPTVVTTMPPLCHASVEVAGLIARGLTNRRSPRALVISERTVHRHVGNILDKLDLRSRAQVAVWVAERGVRRLTRRSEGLASPGSERAAPSGRYPSSGACSGMGIANGQVCACGAPPAAVA